MGFEIDVSGSDIFEKDYTVLVAEVNKKIILGHKFPEKTIKSIRAKHGQGFYRYKVSKQGKSNLKVRLYCVTIYFIFKELKKRICHLKEVNLTICKDFSGKEASIRQNLNHFLGNLLGFEVEMIFETLIKGSVADKYAFLIRHDELNKLAKHCIQIELKELEAFLKH